MSNKDILEKMRKERIGMIKENNDGDLMKVLDYNGTKNVLIEFQDEYKETKMVSWIDFNKGIIKNPSKNKKYIGLTSINYNGEIMKIIKYNNSHDIIVEFQDEWKEIKRTAMKEFKSGSVRNPHDIDNRLNSIHYNNFGCKFKVIEYIDSHNVLIEFQDKYKEKIETKWEHVVDGNIINHYSPSVQGIGIVGTKYHITINGSVCKEYLTWVNVLKRCFNEKVKLQQPAYKDVTCCEEWLLYENFYEWMHSQENFDKWVTLNDSAIDKDILVKGNKIYSPDTCCLVPQIVNNLFIKSTKTRGLYPIGVNKEVKKYNSKHGTYTYSEYAASSTQSDKNSRYIGTYQTPDDAFYAYKTEKEKYIKYIAHQEFNAGNISRKCYETMMNYKVEITD